MSLSLSYMESPGPLPTLRIIFRASSALVRTPFVFPGWHLTFRPDLDKVGTG